MQGVVGHGEQSPGAVAEVAGDGQSTPTGELAGAGEMHVVEIGERPDDLVRSFVDPLEDGVRLVVGGHPAIMGAAPL